MSEKLRFFWHRDDIILIYNCKIRILIFNFDFLKETACQNLHFKISLYIGQNTDMSEK